VFRKYDDGGKKREGKEKREVLAVIFLIHRKGEIGD